MLLVRLLSLLALYVITERAYSLPQPRFAAEQITWSASLPRQATPWQLAKEPESDFSVAIWVRLSGKTTQYPSLATNKRWDDGEVVDLLSNSNMGNTLSSGNRPGWALAVQPNGSWLWNLGNGKARLDYLPTVERQPILDDRWHLLAFSINQQRKEVRIFYDGVNVAIYATNGFEDARNYQFRDSGGIGGDRAENNSAVDISGKLAHARYWDRSLDDDEMFALYTEKYPDARPPELPESVEQLKVLSWNIWHGARHPGTEKGIQQAIDFIKSTGADVVTMQETYGSGPTIADRLGYYFYLRSSNLSIMSRFPIEESHDLYEPFRFGGATVRLSPTQKINVFSLWIHHVPAWRRNAAADGATAKALIADEWTTRARELRDILRELKPFIKQADRTPLIVGGDFNSPSSLDWTEDTKNWHQDLVVDWPVSKQMIDAGFADSYRYIHADPTKFEPSDSYSADARQLTFRIDYLYSLGKLITPIASRMMNQHNGSWPSDHPAVLSNYQLKKKSLRVVTYNIWEGFRGEPTDRFPSGEKRLLLVSEWLADQQPDIIGFQELNGFSRQRLQEIAAAWNHLHTARLKEDGYIVALSSRYPIEVVERLTTNMHHGLLHCRTAGIDCFVVHLSPFSFRHRQSEVQAILDRVARVRSEGKSVLLMGDFNAFSPKDREIHQSDPSMIQRLRQVDANHDHVQNLNNGAIDYTVIDDVLESGLVDLYALHRRTLGQSQSRIDYIFASADLAEKCKAAEWFVTEKHKAMSDHFPVSADIGWPSNKVERSIGEQRSH